MNPENQLYNLIRFVVIFTGEVNRSSSDYILEKYNKYIGFKPIKNNGAPTERIKIWEVSWGDSKSIKNQLHFLTSINGGKNLSDIIELFEKHIGPFDMINDIEMSGLHPLLEGKVVESVFSGNKLFITKFLRDKNINNILK